MNKQLKNFIFVALLQFVVLVYPVYIWQDITNSGTEYKFLVEISPPHKTFSGYYLNLNFATSKFTTTEKIPTNKQLYALLTIDQQGFYQISAVKQDLPQNNNSYFLTKLNYQHNNELHLDIPFNKYYINERTAKSLALQSLEKQSGNYAIVSIKNGHGVIKQIYYNDIPLIN